LTREETRAPSGEGGEAQAPTPRSSGMTRAPCPSFVSGCCARGLGPAVIASTPARWIRLAGRVRLKLAPAKAAASRVRRE
jgi:hypothetical protein